jgi:hypothetical protein
MWWNKRRPEIVEDFERDGELAWRQHDDGHEDRSNMEHCIAWANKLIEHTPPPAAPAK